MLVVWFGLGKARVWLQLQLIAVKRILFSDSSCVILATMAVIEQTSVYLNSISSGRGCKVPWRRLFPLGFHFFDAENSFSDDQTQEHGSKHTHMSF